MWIPCASSMHTYFQVTRGHHHNDAFSSSSLKKLGNPFMMIFSTLRISYCTTTTSESHTTFNERNRKIHIIKWTRGLTKVGHFNVPRMTTLEEVAALLWPHQCWPTHLSELGFKGRRNASPVIITVGAFTLCASKEWNISWLTGTEISNETWCSVLILAEWQV